MMANANANAFSSEMAKKAADIIGTFPPNSKNDNIGLFGDNVNLAQKYLKHENEAETLLSSLPKPFVEKIKEEIELKQTPILAEMDILLKSNDPNINQLEIPTLQKLKEEIKKEHKSTQIQTEHKSTQIKIAHKLTQNNSKKTNIWRGGYLLDPNAYSYDPDNDDDDDDDYGEGIYWVALLKCLFCWIVSPRFKSNKCDFRKNGGKGKKNIATHTPTTKQLVKTFNGVTRARKVWTLKNKEYIKVRVDGKYIFKKI